MCHLLHNLMIATSSIDPRKQPTNQNLFKIVYIFFFPLICNAICKCCIKKMYISIKKGAPNCENQVKRIKTISVMRVFYDSNFFLCRNGQRY